MTKIDNIPTIALGNDHIYHVGLVQLINLVGASQAAPVIIPVSRLQDVSVQLSHDCCATRFDVPWSITEGDILMVELTAEIQDRYGEGVYNLHLSAREPNDSYHDGYRHISRSQPLCRVTQLAEVTDPLPSPASSIDMVVLSALRGERGRDAETPRLSVGNDGHLYAKYQDGHPIDLGRVRGTDAPRPVLTYRKDVASGLTYLYADGQEILDEVGGRVPLHRVLGSVITATEVIATEDMTPRLSTTAWRNLSYTYPPVHRDDVYGTRLEPNSPFVRHLQGQNNTIRTGGWTPGFDSNYHCGVTITFAEINLQPVFDLVRQRRDINLVVRLVLYADGYATLSELGAGGNADTRDCRAHEIVDLSIPLYVNTGMITMTAMTANMPRPTEPCMQLLDYRFVLMS